MMGVAYDADPHRESPLKEEDIEAVHDCGLKIHGFPDRVEKLDDGSYIVVDFKTKRKIDHQKDDVGTCLQVMIYAYILERALGYKITRGEYRYLRLNETVTCEYNQEKKEELADYLQTFKEHLERGFFPLPSDKTPDEMKEICKYCKFDGICGKNPDWEVKGVD